MVFFIFQGHEKEALNLMAAYLPKDNSPGSAFAEGGGLYALGMPLQTFRGFWNFLELITYANMPSLDVHIDVYSEARRLNFCRIPISTYILCL